MQQPYWVAAKDVKWVLYESFEALRTARVAQDERIETFTAGLTHEFLARSLPYVNNQGRPLDDPAAMLLAHFFNHQTHHRGQIHDLLTQTEVTPPSLDLHRVLRPLPAGKVRREG